MASKIHQLLKKSGGLIKSTNISSLLNKHQYRPVVSSPLTHYRSEKQQGFGFLNFCTVPSKIHLFKKSAIEAGTPENYYLRPSDNLMKLTSEWRVVEHEDHLALTFYLHDFGDFAWIEMNQGKFLNIEVKIENRRRGVARFHHKDGMKKFSIEMNPYFLKLKVKADDVQGSDGISRIYITKLTPQEIKEKKMNPYSEPEEEKKSKGPYTLTINTGLIRD